MAIRNPQNAKGKKMKKNGFVDLQVNGYKGINFGSHNLSMEDVHKATRALVNAGTVAFCPVSISNSSMSTENARPAE